VALINNPEIDITDLLKIVKDRLSHCRIYLRREEIRKIIS